MTNFSTMPLCTFQPARFFDRRSATQRAAIAVSACLTGEKVRYDGADKRLPACALLDRELTLIPICPELGAGLGVPRPPVQLIKIGDEVRAQGRENRQLDVTAALHHFATRSLQQLSREHLLCGYLWKSRSPSCGLGSTPLFDAVGVEIGYASGIQAGYFRQHLPHIIHCEERALTTASAACHFVLRCRLVFDVLSAAAASLPALHHHYAFLHENFDAASTRALQELSLTQHNTAYLAVLLTGCSRISEDVLLKLFQ